MLQISIVLEAPLEKADCTRLSLPWHATHAFSQGNSSVKSVVCACAVDPAAFVSGDEQRGYHSVTLCGQGRHWRCFGFSYPLGAVLRGASRCFEVLLGRLDSCNSSSRGGSSSECKALKDGYESLGTLFLQRQVTSQEPSRIGSVRPYERRGTR